MFHARNIPCSSLNTISGFPGGISFLPYFFSTFFYHHLPLVTFLFIPTILSFCYKMLHDFIFTHDVYCPRRFLHFFLLHIFIFPPKFFMPLFKIRYLILRHGLYLSLYLIPTFFSSFVLSSSYRRCLFYESNEPMSYESMSQCM